MSDGRFYLTTSIPYVNARPHLGHALEFVQADVLARHRRRRGFEVRLQSGTDDNALKNVQAARERGEAVQAFVTRNADAFAALREPLEVSFDDFIRTSADERHRPAVEGLWTACATDLYRRSYEGLYCVGCEQFYELDELVDGRCPEHGTVAQRVAEENWFFRLSRYAGELYALIDRGEIRVEPEARRTEALRFIRGGLRDISVSRDAERAGGWGIPVPGDPSQVIYVWFDALANYISALGFGSEPEQYRKWWTHSLERVHVIGKGILRFHALLWPAILLSAGEPLPTTIFVHDYLSANGQKLSKTSGNGADPSALVERYGADAVRWWLVRDVPRVGDTDFTEKRLVERYNADLAGGIGNLVARVAALSRRWAPVASIGSEARHDCLADAIDCALSSFDFRRAAEAILDLVRDANRLLERARPWENPDDEDSREAVCSAEATARTVATELEPFLPSASARLIATLNGTPRAAPLPRIK